MGRFASVIKQKSQNSVVLYRATARDGQEFYAYIRCNEKQSQKMKHDFMTQTHCRDVADYGEVLYTGPGREPDENARNFLNRYLKAM